MGVFDSFSYGAKSLARLLRKGWKPAQNNKDGYIEYVRSRPRRSEVSTMMILAGVFAVGSAVVAAIAG